jgi:TP901 family phage tail tape measure protein
MGALPPVFIEFLGRSTGFMATAKGVKTELASVERDGGKNMRKLGGVAKAALLGIGVAAGVAAVKTVHMAADFQTQMTRVRTGAGEAAKNMQLVGDGVLHMAGQVGESTKDLTAGLYMVESAGFHGQNALDVLRVSAQGAKVGAADLATVTDAVTTAMNAYNLQSADAATNTQHTTDVMNALVGTEAEGKTNLEALAGSMSGILPVAAAAKVKLNEVLGAMATMTSQGTDARVSATYLRQTIGQLSNPSAKAAATMKGLGLNANSVSKELGSKGLAATLDTLTNAIKKKMGPGGDVFIKTLQKAAKSSKDFNGALEKASGSKKTYIGALSTMVGGTKSMMGALMLTGSHMDTFKKNVDGIGDHVKDGGKNIEGWSDVQKTFNQRMAEFKGSIEGISITLGQKLLPYATTFIGWLAKGIPFLQANAAYLKMFGLVLGAVTIGLAAASIASWSFTDSLLANPVTWIVAGIVALVAGLAMLILHWRQVWTWIQTNIPAVANAFKSTWRATLNAFHVAWAMAMKAVHGVVRWFNSNVLTWLKARVGDVVAWWKSHSTEIKQTWALLWKEIQRYVKVGYSIVKVQLGLLWTSMKVYWDLISGAVKIAWDVISGATKFGMHYIMNLIAVVTDIITGHWGKAWQDVKKLVSQAFSDIWDTIKSSTADFGTALLSAGKDLIQGLIDGVEDMAGAAWDAVKNVASGLKDTAKSILHINSPSKVFRDEVGAAIPEGIALGVTQNAHLAHGAVRGTAKGMVRHFKSELGINSPSKVFRQLGIWVHEGLVEGLTGSLSKVKGAIKKTETQLMQAMNRLHDMSAPKGKKGASLRKWIASHEHAVASLEKSVKKEGAQLEKLADYRDGVAKRLKKAQTNLTNLQKAWTQERDDVASSIMQGASVVVQNQADGVSLTVGDVMANMQTQVAAATQFANELKALKDRGLSSDLLSQIAAAGVEQGGATAQALLGANSGQIAQLNQMQGQLSTSANSAGAVVADSMYKSGIAAANGLVKGLQSQEKAIDKQMLKIAKSMEKAIKHALGIKSPSRLFAEIGRFVTAGLVGGIDSGNRDVQNAATRMSDAVVRGADMPSLGGSAGASRGVVQHNVHIEVHGSVRTDRDLRDVIQQEMYRYGGRNSTTWQQFKR